VPKRTWGLSIYKEQDVTPVMGGNIDVRQKGELKKLR
jgi:hypothetical protein